MSIVPQDWTPTASAIFYDDPRAAIDWLGKAFGFEVRIVVDGPDNAVMHSELVMGDALIQVATEDEAIEVVMAMTQLYRANAKYLDRIYKWMAKVGLEWIQDQIADLENRKGLVDRFELSQSIYRKDPWAEHAEEKAETYQPVANYKLEAAE